MMIGEKDLPRIAVDCPSPGFDKSNELSLKFIILAIVSTREMRKKNGGRKKNPKPKQDQALPPENSAPPPPELRTWGSGLFSSLAQRLPCRRIHE
ncbi:protein of unknown function [Methylacidimicrobium sp. AP8]|nr:protein of unknown function [Methylacidimicrobium sp. AP8]